MADEKLQIVIEAFDRASATLKGVAGNAKGIGDAAKATGAATEGAFGRAATALKPYEGAIRSASVAMVGLGAVVTGVAAKCVAGFIEETEAVSALNVALKNTGAAVNSAQLVKLAEQLGQVTRFGHDTTISMMGVLAAMGFTEQQILRLTPVVQNLAVAFHKDLEGTARALGRAILMESAAPLTRFGIIVDDTVMKTGDLNAILQEVGRNTEGMAVADEKARGGIDALKDSTDQLSDSVGKALLPSLTLLNKTFVPILNHMAEIADSPVGKAMVFVGTTAGLAAAGLGTIGLAAPPIIRGLAAIEYALIKLGLRSRATATTVAASAGEMAAATLAAGAGAGAAGAGAGAGAAKTAIATGTGAAAGGAAARYGVRGLLRGGARLASRYLPWAIAAEAGYEGSKWYFGRKQAAAEAQIADIEGAPYNDLQRSNMARWQAARGGAAAPGALPAGLALPSEDEIAEAIGLASVPSGQALALPSDTMIASEIADRVAGPKGQAKGKPVKAEDLWMMWQRGQILGSEYTQLSRQQQAGKLTDQDLKQFMGQKKATAAAIAAGELAPPSLAEQFAQGVPANQLKAQLRQGILAGDITNLGQTEQTIFGMFNPRQQASLLRRLSADDVPGLARVGQGAYYLAGQADTEATRILKARNAARNQAWIRSRRALPRIPGQSPEDLREMARRAQFADRYTVAGLAVPNALEPEPYPFEVPLDIVATGPSTPESRLLRRRGPRLPPHGRLAHSPIDGSTRPDRYVEFLTEEEEPEPEPALIPAARPRRRPRAWATVATPIDQIPGQSPEALRAMARRAELADRYAIAGLAIPRELQPETYPADETPDIVARGPSTPESELLRRRGPRLPPHGRLAHSPIDGLNVSESSEGGTRKVLIEVVIPETLPGNLTDATDDYFADLAYWQQGVR